MRRLDEHCIPQASFVLDLPLVSRIKHQPSQRTMEQTRTGERVPVPHSKTQVMEIILFAGHTENQCTQNLGRNPHTGLDRKSVQ